MEAHRPPLFLWGVIDITGKVSLEVFDTGDDRRRFAIRSDPADQVSRIFLDEAALRCIRRHLQAALDRIDAA